MFKEEVEIPFKTKVKGFLFKKIKVLNARVVTWFNVLSNKVYAFIIIDNFLKCAKKILVYYKNNLAPRT